MKGILTDRKKQGLGVQGREKRRERKERGAKKEETEAKKERGREESKWDAADPTRSSGLKWPFGVLSIRGEEAGPLDLCTEESQSPRGDSLL